MNRHTVWLLAIDIFLCAFSLSICSYVLAGCLLNLYNAIGVSHEVHKT